MISLKDKLESLSLVDKSIFLSEALTCCTEYLLSEKREVIEFEDSDFVSILTDGVKYFELREDGLFDSEVFDIEDFMSMIYEMSKAELYSLDEELVRLEKIGSVESKIDSIITDLWKATLKSSLSEFEIAYGKRDI